MTIVQNATSSTSLVVSWRMERGNSVEGYNISFSSTAGQCVSDSDNVTGIGGNDTSYNITGLEEGTEYAITVTALLVGGVTDEASVTATTPATGE